MSILFLILPLTLLFSFGFVAAYAWATRTGQLDDLETPAVRALHDDSRAISAPEPAETRPLRSTHTVTAKN